MAEILDDGEFWLPPQFLTDDDMLMEKKNSTTPNLKSTKGVFGCDTDSARKPLFPFEFSYGFGSGSFSVSSDLSSPVESVVGSTETESDEEDGYLTGLTRQLAHSTLDTGFRRNDVTLDTENSKGRVLSGSPQSTLCAVGRGCGCRKGSSHGSPNGSSRVSTPPATWDLLYAAAGEVARLRMNDEYGLNSQSSRGVLGPPVKPSPVSISMKNTTPDVNLYPQQLLSYQKLQASEFHHLRQQQMMKQQQGSGISGGQQAKGTGLYQQHQAQPVVHNRGRNIVRPLGLSASAWPSLQQATHPPHQGGSGMRAVFLGNPGGKRECAGTGVFLPRRVGTPTETRKKPACSTVLLPARVVQALNLNLDDMGAQRQFQPRFNANFTPDSDAAAALRLLNSNLVSNQMRNLRRQPVMNNEVGLPQEWTY